MNRKNIFDTTVYNLSEEESGIHQSLKNIEQYLLTELTIKQKMIDEKKSELAMLHFLVEEKNQAMQQMQSKIVECQQNIEGNRQLINKLLNDQGRMQQDIEWYKRTYETRTIFGLLKDRVKYFLNNLS
ncbi:MAG: hypothetical protein JWP69_545 [Flaviaesturariibacter sp.]|nr:hypothetical protein [Flaviaesturariibacter sp.]